MMYTLTKEQDKLLELWMNLAWLSKTEKGRLKIIKDSKKYSESERDYLNKKRKAYIKLIE